LQNLLLLGAATSLDTLGGRTDVALGDPALIVALASREAGGLGSGEVGINDGLDNLGLAGGGAASLGEESLDPGLVDEVDGAGESASEEEVEEDASAEKLAT